MRPLLELRARAAGGTELEGQIIASRTDVRHAVFWGDALHQDKRVLVVDDDAGIRSLLQSLLTIGKLSVDTATNGDEALRMIASDRYSVIVLDLLMPVLDGFAVLEALRAAVPDEPPVVIVVTGADDSIVKGLDPAIVHGIIRKPFDADELAELVWRCAEIRSQSRFEKMALAAAVAGAPLMALLTSKI